MTPDRLAQIRAAAEAATRIPNGCCHAGADVHHRHFLHSFLDGSAAKTPWGRFIATADPPTVLALVAEVERLTEVAERRFAIFTAAQNEVTEVKAERDDARALVDAVERPTAGEDDDPRNWCNNCGHDAGLHDNGVSSCCWLERGPCMCERFVAASPADPVSDHGDSVSENKRQSDTDPAAPVSEARCRCGHVEQGHVYMARLRKVLCAFPDCPCTAFTPDLPPATPREELADASHYVCGRCGFDGYTEITRPELFTPRVARSLGDLRVGQVVAVKEVGDSWLDHHTWTVKPDDLEEPDFSFEDTDVLILSDPPAGAVTPPTTADLPTTPGSVIEATWANDDGTHGFSGLFMRRDDPEWPWRAAEGGAYAEAQMALVRVLFDAGERGEP